MQEYFCCFPLNYIRTHALHHDLLRHLTFLYTLIFARALHFLPSCKLPSLCHLGTTCKSGSAARCAATGSTRPCQNCFHFAIESECKFWYARRLPLILYVFHYSLKTYFISVYLYFAFYFVSIGL